MRERLLVALLTAIAALLRFGDLTAQSLWLDEYLWTQSSAASVGHILRLGDGYPPLFGLLVHALLRAGLDSDWWLRAPAALAGTLAVPLTYAVGRRVAGRSAAVAAAMLVAINPMAIWYSQECGAYALLVLAALASTLAFLRLLAGGTRADALAYAVAVCLGFGLHYYFVFVVAAQAMVAAWDAVRWPQRRALWTCLAFAALAGFALWGFAFLWDVGAQAAEDRARPASLLALPYTILTFVGGFSLGPPLRALHWTVYSDAPFWEVIGRYSIVSALAVAVTIALAAVPLTRRWTAARALAALLVVVPVLGAWLASAVVVGYHPRYAVAALPIAAIWCASALRTRFRRLALTLLMVLALLQITALRRIDDAAYAREDTRAAAEYVAERGGSALVVLVGDAAEPFGRYALGATRVVGLTPHDVADEAALRTRLDAALDGRSEVWLVSARPWTVDPDGRVRALLDGRLAAREEAQFAGVALRRYVAPPRPRDTIARGDPRS